MPNPNLKTEFTQNYELGMQYSKGIVNLSAYGFYTNFNNAIVTDFFSYNGKDSALYNGNMTRVFASQNKAKAFLYGGGMEGTIRPTSNFSIFASINYTYGRFDNDSSLVPLDQIPPINGRIAVSYTHLDVYKRQV